VWKSGREVQFPCGSGPAGTTKIALLQQVESRSDCFRDDHPSAVTKEFGDGRHSTCQVDSVRVVSSRRSLRVQVRGQSVTGSVSARCMNSKV
jgi:hypothetical protein